MLNFLIRNEYLRPSYREDYDFPERQKRQPRGNTRYWSYRDLIIAKAIRRLLDAGVQLIRVKRALESLREDEHWLLKTKGFAADRAINWLVTDGKEVYLRDHRGFLELIGNGRQRAFAFVVEMKSVRSEVRAAIRSNYPTKITHFRLINAAPLFDPPRSMRVQGPHRKR
jgi:DNA-binding transcriptional MerR regulator